MNKTSKSFAQKRILNSSTPVSIYSRTSKKISKQEPTIEDIYNEVRVKIGEMESVFKEEHLGREREMLKTYVKILDKIGAQVMTAKQKYLNLDKQNLKTDKRLQIVTQLNQQRQQCNILTKNIKTIRQEIKKYQDQNNYLQNQVQALQQIATRKKFLSKSEHQKYRSSKQKAKSLQKRWSYSIKQNDKLMTMKAAGTLEYSAERFDIKVRTKSFMMNSQEPEGEESRKDKIKEERPQTQQNYLGSRRRKGYGSKMMQENVEMV